MDLLLPKDGSIVIIDDKYIDAKPLLDILTQNGHPSIYFDGKIDNLPKNNKNQNIFLERVRIVFADLQLVDALDDQQYASLIIEHLNLLIPDSNGPYVLIVWSGREIQLADRLKEMIDAAEFVKKPIAFIRLNKGDYFKTKITKPLDYELIKEEFATRFDAQDISFILERLEDNLPDIEEKTCDPKALKKISNKIRQELKNYQAFELLINWEYLVTHTATKLTSELASIHTVNEQWDYNFRNIISRLAQAQVGEHIQTLNGLDFIKASFKTINSAFYDSLNNDVETLIKITPTEFLAYKESGYRKVDTNEVYTIFWNNFKHYELHIEGQKKGGNLSKIDRLPGILGNDANRKAVVQSMVNDYTNINPILNTKLNIDFKTNSPFQPGTTYKIDVDGEHKRKFLNETYFKVDSINFLEKNADDTYKIPDNELEEISFIEVEVSPNCDFANNKWLKHRTVSGILFPTKIELKKLQDSDSFYDGFPKLKIDQDFYYLIISFKLLKSFDVSKGKKRAKNFLFKIKEQPMADIITRMASHATRIGIIEFK